MKVLEEIKEKCCSHCEAECDGCWLKELIAEHDKQVRKEMVQEIRNKIEQAKMIYEWKGKEITIEEILDQIQGE